MHCVLPRRCKSASRCWGVRRSVWCISFHHAASSGPSPPPPLPRFRFPPPPSPRPSDLPTECISWSALFPLSKVGPANQTQRKTRAQHEKNIMIVATHNISTQSWYGSRSSPIAPLYTVRFFAHEIGISIGRIPYIDEIPWSIPENNDVFASYPIPSIVDAPAVIHRAIHVFPLHAQSQDIPIALPPPCFRGEISQKRVDSRGEKPEAS